MVMQEMNKITFVAYDTICTVCISGPTEESSRLLLEKAKRLALLVHNTLSMYDPDSELSKLCASYTFGKPAVVSKMLYDFIKLNLEFSQQTDGAFDFTVGPLVKLWDFLGDHPQIPGDQDLERVKKRVGFHHVHLSSARQEVVFDAADMMLDPGASGKGYALQLVSDFLKESGVKKGVLDFGGNLFVLGSKPSTEGKEEPWSVGIRCPDKKSMIGAVNLSDRGIATSSWYEHCFRKGGRIYHHLLDPLTGRPQEMDISSVSIISSKAVYTDFLSTAFFVMGFEAGCKLATHIRDRKGIDVDYVVLKKDGRLLASKGACLLS